jgi:hypothetical protein
MHFKNVSDLKNIKFIFLCIDIKNKLKKNILIYFHTKNILKKAIYIIILNT